MILIPLSSRSIVNKYSLLQNFVQCYPVNETFIYAIKSKKY